MSAARQLLNLHSCNIDHNYHTKITDILGPFSLKFGLNS